MCYAPNTFWFWVLGLFMHFHCYWGRGVSLFCFSMVLSFSFWCIWLLYATVWMNSTLEQAQILWNPVVSFSILALIFFFNENFWLRFTFSFSLYTNCMYFAFEYYNCGGAKTWALPLGLSPTFYQQYIRGEEIMGESRN